MTPRNPRGSEWRKWDLHLHAPGTKLGDAYARSGDVPPMDYFCQLIRDSDVSVVAIADYFSLDGYFSVKERFEELYPEDETVLLPNLELRLPLALNRDTQEVNIHLIFNPSLSKIQASKFLGRLNTGNTQGRDRATVTCADLQSSRDYQSATVTHDAINHAIKETFGVHAVVPHRRQEYLMVVASAKGDGIRPGGSGIERKRLLTDVIDEFSDAVFSNNGSRDYYLDVNRPEGKKLAVAKPVFDGCDAHSFPSMVETLGKHVPSEENFRSITWIKAEPSYEGLLQTLIEPADRVAIQAVEPDRKEPYKVISKVKFPGSADFPEEVVFNRNLNSIIGSRSSGKSALLAFMSYAVDPQETVRKQVEAGGLSDDKKAGPAAGLTWSEVSHIDCEVEWASGELGSGKVIYIPQNSLYKLSEQPQEITRKIEPALFRTYPEVKVAVDRTNGVILTANKDIQDEVLTWFELTEKVRGKDQEILDLGNKSAISAERDRLQEEVNRIQAGAELSDEEVANYQEISEELKNSETRIAEIESGLSQLSSYVKEVEGGERQLTAIPDTVSIAVTVRPSGTELPDSLAQRIEELRMQAARDLKDEVEKTLEAAVSTLKTEKSDLANAVETLTSDNSGLLEKHQANRELAEVVNLHKKQLSTLDSIKKAETDRQKLATLKDGSSTRISDLLAKRDRALETLKTIFDEEQRELSGLRFGLEIGPPATQLEHATLGFNRRRSTDYLESGSEAVVDYDKAQAEPAEFLEDLSSGRISLKSGYEPQAVGSEVLSLTQEVRFSAVLDSDRIGGFQKPSMTPGKQALFALTLILNESQEPWPLLIDQPEDDLDSRSIYETIVPYLVERKKERQIIMVSHNANLVIGADSEQVTVANRHGDDRKNMDGRTFEYLTGALEHSSPAQRKSKTTLGRFGIREHACEILDGGEEAFRKRREKYNLISNV